MSRGTIEEVTKDWINFNEEEPVKIEVPFTKDDIGDININLLEAVNSENNIFLSILSTITRKYNNSNISKYKDNVKKIEEFLFNGRIYITPVLDFIFSFTDSILQNIALYYLFIFTIVIIENDLLKYTFFKVFYIIYYYSYMIQIPSYAK
jgi:hypothetical protein